MKAKLDAMWIEYCRAVPYENENYAHMEFGPYPASRLRSDSGYLMCIRNWALQVLDILGPDATLEWVAGSCIVQGVMVFPCPEST